MNELDETKASAPPERAKPSRRRPVMFGIGAAGLLAVAAGAVVANNSDGFGPGMMRLGGPMGFMHGPIDPAKAEAHAERMARHLAVEIDATKDQEIKLAAIAKALVKDILPIRDKAKDARDKALDLLGTTVDRAAVETFRAEQLANADAASRRFAQAVTEMAEVLTPEQRVVLKQRIAEWREHRSWFRRWRHG